MNTEYMTKKELKAAVQAALQKATLKDQKWLYCYFNDMDEWPLITDEVPAAARMQVETGVD
tara:strand:+ start:453 stop:635 length:183 start_codon:yes stop_codon:yes gene_type:complete